MKSTTCEHCESQREGRKCRVCGNICYYCFVTCAWGLDNNSQLTNDDFWPD